MASYKAFLLVSFFLALSNQQGTALAEEPKCDCGIFKMPTADTTTEEPLTSKSPNFKFVCDADGKESCSNMCKTLATGFKQEGPQTICELVKDTEAPYTPLVYYRACDDKEWTFTGLTSSLQVCCKASKVVPCV